eukprot:PhF_6_TR15586/c0_g1_i1/m.24190
MINPSTFDLLTFALTQINQDIIHFDVQQERHSNLWNAICVISSCNEDFIATDVHQDVALNRCFQLALQNLCLTYGMDLLTVKHAYIAALTRQQQEQQQTTTTTTTRSLSPPPSPDADDPMLNLNPDLVPRHIPANYTSSTHHYEGNDDNMTAKEKYYIECDVVSAWMPAGWSTMTVAGNRVLYLDHLSRQAYYEPPWVVYEVMNARGASNH